MSVPLPPRSRDSAFNARWRLILAALEDARSECTPAEWYALLELLDERVANYRRRDRRAGLGAA